MNFLEMWEIIFKPIFQFLVGPIITGLVIFKMTNKAANKREKSNETRQLNILKAKLERIVVLVEEVNNKLEEDEILSLRLREMSLGDFSVVEEEIEYSHEGNEENFLRLYKSSKEEGQKDVLKLTGQIKEVSLELKDIPMDALPTKIHGKLHELIEMKQIELDLVKVKSLVRLVKKEI